MFIGTVYSVYTLYVIPAKAGIQWVGPKHKGQYSELSDCFS